MLTPVEKCQLKAYAASFGTAQDARVNGHRSLRSILMDHRRAGRLRPRPGVSVLA
jgi:hypothetical protein